jgi:hypothetical protein
LILVFEVAVGVEELREIFLALGGKVMGGFLATVSGVPVEL